MPKPSANAGVPMSAIAALRAVVANTQAEDLRGLRCRLLLQVYDPGAQNYKGIKRAMFVTPPADKIESSVGYLEVTWQAIKQATIVTPRVHRRRLIALKAGTSQAAPAARSSGA